MPIKGSEGKNILVLPSSNSKDKGMDRDNRPKKPKYTLKRTTNNAAKSISEIPK